MKGIWKTSVPFYVRMVRIITATFYSLLEVGTKYGGVRLKKVTFTTPTAEAGEINEFGWVIGHPTLFGVLHFGMPLSIIIYSTKMRTSRA